MKYRYQKMKNNKTDEPIWVVQVQPVAGQEWRLLMEDGQIFAFKDKQYAKRVVDLLRMQEAA